MDFEEKLTVLCLLKVQFRKRQLLFKVINSSIKFSCNHGIARSLIMLHIMHA